MAVVCACNSVRPLYLEPNMVSVGNLLTLDLAGD